MVWILNVILILIFSLIGTREASLENNNNKNNNGNNNNNNNDDYYYYYYYYYHYYCYNNKRYQRSKDGAVVRALALTPPWVGFDPWTYLVMWVEFVNGSRCCSKGFLSLSIPISSLHNTTT